MTQDEINRQLIESMTELASVMSSLTGNTTILNSTLAKNKKAFDDMHPAIQAEILARRQAEIAAGNQAKAETQATASVVSLGKAFLSAEQGFSKFSAGLDSAGSAAWALSKNFGVLGMAAGALMLGVTKVAGAALKQADNVLKATDELSEMGSAGAFGAEEVRRMGTSMGLTSENISVFTKAVKTAGSGVISLGNTAGEGVAEFAKLTSVTSEQRQAFQRLGVSQEQLAENQGEYVRNLQASGVVITEQMKRDGSLKRASLEYTENLLQLSALTGKSTKELKDKIAVEQTQFQFRIKQSSLSLEAADAEAAGDTVKAAQLRRQVEANDKFLKAAIATNDQQQILAVQSLIATEAVTKDNAVQERLGIDQAKFLQKLKEGQDVTLEYQKDYTNGVQNNVRSLSQAGAYSETTAKAYGIAGNGVGFAMSKVGKDIDAAGKKAAADIGSPKDGTTGAKTEQDPAQIARNKLTEAEIAAKVALDNLLASVNPLMNGFNSTTIAATALTAAALAASVALAGIAASKALGGLTGREGAGTGPTSRGGGGSGGTSSGPKPAGALSALGRFAGPLAGLVSVGTGIMTVADGLKNANTAQEKGGVIGKGTGQAAGGVGGALAGAAIGTAVLPVVGTAIGAAIGGWLGSKGGEAVGEKVGEVAGKAFESPEAKKIQEDDSNATKNLINSLDSLRISIDALRRITATSSTLGGGGGGAAAGGGSAPAAPTAKPSSQPPDGSVTTGANKVDVSKVLKFGTGSGSQQNFEGLQPQFKDAVTAAASEYNAITGNKITINSAKRDSADQQRLYDESVAAGRPGRGPTGMAIGKPGSSLHEKGEAVDIQNYKDQLAVAAFNRQGLLQKVPGDPVHFQAMKGGILNGPMSGYPVAGTMHGPEAIMPLKPDSIIAKLINTSEAQLKQEMTTNNTTNTTSSNDITSQIMEDLYVMMEEKFDAMLDALETGNSTADKLLKSSRV